ncbi:MAG: ATP-dependent Clp protease ATP-binding subunit, partial [Clostridia bacterium]|nr:ATP-dependent Clp protease ATP-binding subunit [Clostridia bacterium]
RDLTALAREGKLDPVIGRETETERVVQILSRRTKNNPCLIGEPGVGKTAVVEGLAQRIADGSVPETLTDKKIITLDIPGMIAGAKYRGEFEERMKGVMNEVMKDKSIILFIDEIHTIIGAGAAEGAVDAANILKPALARGDMQVIGATTINEYRKHIEKDAALERRFQSVMVGEPSPEEAELILKGLRDKYEAHHKVKITDEAIEAAVKYSVRYIGDRYLPDKAIDLIDEAASKLRISSYTAPDSIKELENKLKQISSEKEEAIGSQEFERAAKLRDEEKKLRDEIEKAKTEWKEGNNRDNLTIGESEIAEVVTEWTGIPVKSLTEDEGTRLMHLEEELHKRIVGQSEAVNAVSRAIRRSRVGLKDPRRPMGSFIFLGPTGVGKTELCKALAEILFGDENAMIRVDMSEYMEKHSVSKMIGSPPGYVGFDEGGQLTEKIRRHPYSVVLFDEIEKAHPDVFNILLQILEDGILTDAQGRRVDFKNSIIIMTSNVGASGLIQKASALGFGGDDTPKSEDARIHERVMASLRETFKPEFLNRIDEIIVFSKLSDDEIKEIASLMLKSVEKRLDSMNISISFDDDVIALLAREGTDPVYGARPMRREIQRRIEDALSTEILDGKIAAGDSVQCRLDGDNILFEKSK